jgi:hypothetical protein
MSQPVILHLRIRAAAGQREALIAFVREAKTKEGILVAK